MGNIADEGIREQAEAVAHQARAVIPCPECGSYDVNAQDAEANSRAYAIATNLHKDGEIPGSLDEFKAEVKAAIDDANIDCPDCEQDRGD